MGRLDIPRISRGFFATVMPFRTEEGRNRYDAQSFLRTMEEVLAAQEAAAGASRVDFEIYDHARYAMVVLVDELAIVSDWTHRNDWAQEPLELKIYNSNVGGEDFFTRMKDLKERFSRSRNDDERETILGALEVFYTCLECGFKGRFRGLAEGEIEAERRGLLGLLWPEAEHKRQPYLFPGSYGEGGKTESRQRRLNLWPFIAIGSLVLLFVVYFAFQFILGGRVDSIKGVVRDREAQALNALEEESK
jgi:type IV/VI secretion system ImpK/VasF family protein